MMGAGKKAVIMAGHERYMRIALDLAAKAAGMTSPNPLVGAVVVKARRIVGKGYHREAGLPHAEVYALAAAGKRASGAMLYVTLEPCDHYGRTPPCTDAIIRSGIKTVVIGMNDPNPITRGKGVRKLRRHGIAVVTGILNEEARAINRPYLKWVTKRIPYVTIKAAQSLDGKIATALGGSQWITAPGTRRYARSLRGTVDAVMVGVNTVIKDDPLLTARSGGREPIRIVVDSRLRTPLKARILATASRAPVIIVTARRYPRQRLYEAKGAAVLVVKGRGTTVDLTHLMKTLAAMDITHVMVEGGGTLIGSLVAARLVDRFLFFIAPMVIGGRRALTSVEGAGAKTIGEALRVKITSLRRFGGDILVEAEVR